MCAHPTNTHPPTHSLLGRAFLSASAKGGREEPRVLCAHACRAALLTCRAERRAAAKGNSAWGGALLGASPPRSNTATPAPRLEPVESRLHLRSPP